MSEVLFAALATAFVVSAFEEFVIPLPRFKGLFSPFIVGGMLYALGVNDPATLVVHSFAGGFAVLWVLSTIQEPTVVTRRDSRLPKRIPPL